MSATTPIPNPNDYSEFKADDMAPGDNLMARIEGLAQEQVDAETRVGNLESQLKEAKAALRDLSETRFPDLLDEAQLGDSKITTPAGFVVTLTNIVRGSIPKKNEQEAFDWLEGNNHGALIKRKFVIEFNKDQEQWANKFQRDCAQRKKPLNLSRSKVVHPQTLVAFVRAQLKEGVNFPMETFGVYRQRISKVKVK